MLLRLGVVLLLLFSPAPLPLSSCVVEGILVPELKFNQKKFSFSTTFNRSLLAKGNKRIPPVVIKNNRQCQEDSRISCSLASSQDQLIIGIGVQKAGTGSLYGLLKKIDRIKVLNYLKEFHYFDRSLLSVANVTAAQLRENEELRQYYRDQYLLHWGPIQDLPTRQPWIPTEITPSYASQEEVPYLMMELLKDFKDKVKLILMVRNPTKRAYSGFFLQAPPHTRTSMEFDYFIEEELKILDECYSKGLFVNPNTCPPPEVLHTDIKACVKEHGKRGMPWYEYHADHHLYFADTNEEGVKYVYYDGLIRRGIYVDQLQNYLCAGWKPENIMVASLTELKSQPDKFIKRLQTQLIDGPSNPLHIPHAPHQGSRSEGEMSVATKKKLDNFFRPHNEAFIHLLHTHNFIVDIEAIENELL
eukprot:m.61502 g.61502  ORF g.61502 m.61502 type:complete len:416 (+) comp11392_c0_seq1:85-1332(+)